MLLIDNKPLNDDEFRTHSAATTDVLKILCKAADELNVDRDSYIKATLERMQLIAEISTFKGFEVDSNKERK